ncbi:MAG: RNA-binding S4 domain-containing protein [Candidatus Zixiibacteriota bacterium]|nr:MAG: RNA-binding S4 domain-containing protein [candidate division Zixibacteria bacterium]
MRIDDYLSTVGVIKRRTIAKELGQNGLLVVNGRTIKPAYQVKSGDVIRIKGSHPQTLEVIALPSGSVPKDQRSKYFKQIITQTR